MEGEITTLCTFFLILKFEIWKKSHLFLPITNTYCSRHGSVLLLSLACLNSASLLLFNPTVLADGYYYFVPLYQSLQPAVLTWAHGSGEATRTQMSGSIAHRTRLCCRSQRAAHEQPRSQLHEKPRSTALPFREVFSDAVVRAFL